MNIYNCFMDLKMKSLRAFISKSENLTCETAHALIGSNKF